MHYTKRTTVLFLAFAAFFSACGSGESLDGNSERNEEDGSVNATACPVDDYGCDPGGGGIDPEPVPTYAVGLQVKNQTAQNAVWVTYSVVVRSPSGTVRSAESRWGSMSMDANGTGYLASPAVAHHGDRVEVTLTTSGPGGASSAYGQVVQGPMNCAGQIQPYWGTVVPAVSC